MIDIGMTSLLVVLGTTGLWFIRCFQVRIPRSTPYPYILSWAIGVILGGIALAQGADGSSASWAVGVGATLLFLVFTGAQKVGEDTIKVGDTIPAFSGVDDQGTPFNSSSLAGKRVLIKFFRGHW